MNKHNRFYLSRLGLLGLAYCIGSAPALAQDGTTMTLYGHAMMDMGYETNQSDPNWFDVVRPTKLPSFEGEFGDDGNWFTSVRQSRLGFKTETPTSNGPLKTMIEFELFGVGVDEGQTTFRLRHAWGELGQFGAGQYWSVFMDIDIFPNSIEYWGPSGMILYRNVQFRWTPWSDGDSRFAISLERPGASSDNGKFEDRVELEDVRGDFEVPDLAAHYRIAGDWGHVQVAGMLRKIKWVDVGDDALDLSGNEMGWGLNVTGTFNFGPHVLRASVLYGEGIQNYLNDAVADIGPELNLSDPVTPLVGKPIPVLGVLLFADLNWSDTWTSTIGFSMQDNDPREGQADDAYKKGVYALANILYHPHPRAFMGPEIQYAERTNFRDGFTSDNVRLQFSFKYMFEKVF